MYSYIMASSMYVKQKPHPQRLASPVALAVPIVVQLAIALPKPFKDLDSRDATNGIRSVCGVPGSHGSHDLLTVGFKETFKENVGSARELINACEMGFGEFTASLEKFKHIEPAPRTWVCLVWPSHVAGINQYVNKFQILPLLYSFLQCMIVGQCWKTHAQTHAAGMKSQVQGTVLYELSQGI